MRRPSMISPSTLEPSPMEPEPKARREDFGEVEYLLRRADHETVAAIRAVDPRVTQSHAEMAKHYGEQSRDLIAKLDEKASPADE